MVVDRRMEGEARHHALVVLDRPFEDGIHLLVPGLEEADARGRRPGIDGEDAHRGRLRGQASEERLEPGDRPPEDQRVHV
ncbi:MAG: hypothetical protein KDB18_12685, partial [Salinibacterium sp.]|nr:hypothetical protein [Salinibacterium sp.]